MTGLADSPTGVERHRTRGRHASAGTLGVPALPGAVVVGLAALAGVVGLVMLLWFSVHAPSNADEDVAMILARQAFHGHLQAFYPGQLYGGSAEIYLIAIAFRLFGQTVVVARLVLIGLAAVSSVLVWRIALRLVDVPGVALLAGALSWCAPAVTVRDVTRVYGFRGFATACGLAALLVAVRIYDGRRDWTQCALLGLFLGLGWWSSPEIAYAGLPAALILLMAVVRGPRVDRHRWWGRLIVLAVAFGIGALPWIWSNIRTGLGSLDGSAFSEQAASLGFGGRLHVFFHHVLPMSLGLTRADDGMPLLGAAHNAVFVLFALVLAAAVVLCALRGGPSLAIAVGAVAFPFLYAYSPAAWDWLDGRYSVYLPSLLAIVLAVGATEAVRRLRLAPSAGTWLMAAVLVVAAALSVKGAYDIVSLSRPNFTATWGDPDAPTAAAAARFEAAGIRTAYAPYWVAYKLDFVSGGGMTVATAGYDLDRSAAIATAVAGSPDPAWIFVPTSEARRDADQFVTANLNTAIDSVTQPEFEATLRRLGVPYRIVDVGLARAVVPARKVTPYEAGLPGATPP